MLGSKEIDTINKSDIHNLSLSEKEHREKLLHVIQCANGLKAYAKIQMVR